jgi:putative copper export protein
MEFFEFYCTQILVASIVGGAIGALASVRFALLLPILLVGSGLLTLALTGDWHDFFKNGLTIVHPIYLAGHFLIATIWFGPFGLACGLAARGLRSLIIRQPNQSKEEKS